MKTSTPQYLVLDDDLSIGRIIEHTTQIPVQYFQSLDSLLSSMGNLVPSAAFIDVHLGESNSGLEVIPSLRMKWPHIPIIVLTTDTTDSTIEQAFAVGADDFLQKPIKPTELKARLGARLEEKSNLTLKQVVRYGDLTLHSIHQRLSANGKTTYLSQTAVSLLCSLIEMKGTTVSRNVLKRRVWGRLTLTDNALDRKMYEVRRAIADVESTVVIQNAYGRGYQIITTQHKDLEQAPLNLPLKTAEKIEQIIIEPRKKESIIRVLLIEDQDADAVIVREALRKTDSLANFELKRVKTLNEGLLLSKNGGFDVALLDLSLPDSFGLDTFKKFANSAENLPTIILSGSNNDKLALEAVAHGAQDFISKDEIQPITLSKTIQYALFRSRLSILEKSSLKEKQSQIEALSDLKSQFLANMSHEIRTPMNAVIGMTSLLAQSSLTPDQLECVETIRSSGQALLQIINEILDFSKFQSGKVSLEETTFKLRPVIEEAVSLFSIEADQRGIALFEIIDPKIPSQITGDPARLRQVLVNLIGNALKFTPKGSVTLSVSAIELNCKPMLRFEITDTGIGIKDEEKHRLFEVFSQANLSTTKKFGGTGLGLAISKTIIELMNGTIDFKSVAEKGSTFHFEIPLITQASENFEVRPDLTTYNAVIYCENSPQGRFLSNQLEVRGLHTILNCNESEFTQSIQKTSGTPTTDLAIICCNRESQAEALFHKLKSLDMNPKILWLIPKMSSQPIWQNLNVLRIPYNQSRLYEKVAEMLCETSTLKPVKVIEKNKPQQLLKIHLSLPILVAEDNPVNQRVVQRLLQALGIKSDIVANGVEALHSLENGQYAAVLMDCSMPEMDGWTATEKIRQLGNHIPIIAMTANAFKEDRERCIQSGMNEYLAKPVTLTDLHTMLSRLLKNEGNSSLEVLNQKKLAAINAAGDSQEEDQAFIKELKELFLEHAPATYSEILNLLDSGEPERLKAQAHRLKGLAYNLAAEKLCAVCEKIEQFAAAKRIDDAQSERRSLMEQWKNLVTYLQNDLNSNNSLHTSLEK